jgi:hypothetical protein
METMTFSVNKTTIIALIVGLFVGGVIGCMIGSHHGKYRGEDRAYLSRGFRDDRNTRDIPMIQDMQKMMENKTPQDTLPKVPTATTPTNS